MKKHTKKDARRQARRQRALDRFSLDRDRYREKDTEYIARKETELRSLQRSLGLETKSTITDGKQVVDFKMSARDSRDLAGFPPLT